MHEEGWYADPYARHEARWMSDGKPTALVSDGGVESQDPPPDMPMSGGFERIEGTATAAGGGSDGEACESDTFIETAFQSVNSGGGLYGPPTH